MHRGDADARGGEYSCLYPGKAPSEPQPQPAASPCFIYRTGGNRFNLSKVERKIGEIIQTLRLAKKTSKEDYTQHLRLVGLGLAAVGGVAFVVKLISEFITLGLTGQSGQTG